MPGAHGQPLGSEYVQAARQVRAAAAQQQHRPPKGGGKAPARKPPRNDDSDGEDDPATYAKEAMRDLARFERDMGADSDDD